MLDHCVAPLSTPPPILNATLMSLFLFVRHGTRTPTFLPGWPPPSGDWHCGSRHTPRIRVPFVNGVHHSLAFNASSAHPFSATCGEGSLLDEGFDQLVALGRLYRTYVIDTHKLVPNTLNPELVRIQSSWVGRAIESAVAFTEGFYPPEADGETLNIVTGNQSFDVLVPGFATGSDFGDLPKQFVASEKAAPRLERAFQTYKPIFDHFNISSTEPIDWLAIGDLFIPYHCGHNDLSYQLPDGLYEQMLSDLAFLSYGYMIFREKTYDPIRQFLIDQIEALFAMESKVRFCLLSGHDLTLTALLSGIGYESEVPPGYASHLAVEVWHAGRPMLRFVLNGEVVRVGGRQMIPLADFKSNY
jgi:hypothetical protein